MNDKASTLNVDGQFLIARISSGEIEDATTLKLLRLDSIKSSSWL